MEDGRYAEAERLGRELLAGDVAPDAETRLWLASALRRMRDPRDPEILTLTREAVAELRSTLGEAHPRTAMARRELATVLLMQGELGPARELLEQALAVQREHGPP
ncbi:MAG TPA: tetratricopeptide repeat protein, partial [Planctomycetota bacterium]